tara:strand:+ start:12365 stop:13801 length:1437 start_codon:yes stop_codon:yes gene_type:complete
LSDFTPILGLPYLLSNQAQKHVTLNESLRALDGLLQLAVLNRDQATPPSGPAEGDRHLIFSGATGDWTGHDGELTLFSDGEWHFFVPQTGWRVWVEDEARFLVRHGSGWRETTSDELQNLALLGVGATADANNPLLAKLNDALFTAVESANGGSGDLRVKLNKEAGSNFLSLLFQNGYSSRAEIGLVGDDDLVVKVSPDGAVFHEGLRVDRASGQVSFPNGSPQIRELLSANRTYYIRTDGSDSNDGLADSASGAFLTFARGVEAALSLHHGTHEVTLEFGAGSFSIGGGLIAASADYHINIRGAGYDQTTLDGKLELSGGVIATVRDVHVTGAGQNASLRTGSGASLSILGNVRVSEGTHSHVIATGNSTILLTHGKVRVGAGGVSLFASTTGSLIQLWPGLRVVTETAVSFSNAVARTTECGVITWQSATVDEALGAISGTRFSCNTNGVIQTYSGGATAIPGTVAGTETNGGVYA